MKYTHRLILHVVFLAHVLATDDCIQRAEHALVYFVETYR